MIDSHSLLEQHTGQTRLGALLASLSPRVSQVTRTDNSHGGNGRMKFVG